MKIVASASSGLLALLMSSATLSDAAASHALNDFNQAIVLVDEVETQCYADRGILDSSTFDGLELNNGQIRTVLSYFYYRNLAECTETAVSYFLLKGAVLASLNPDVANDIGESNALILQPHVSAVEREADYLQLPEGLREHLDNIEALKTPFDLMLSGNLLLPDDK